MLTLTALENWHITGVDVKTAFLYGKLDEELFMEQPEGFSEPGQEHKVLRLKRTIYGLKQAALKWWEVLDESMAALGFKRLLSDSEVFVYISKGKGTVIAIIYIDDALFMGTDLSLVNKLKSAFMQTWEC